MASNSFGQVFRITTFGEAHGPGIGVIIDGCPAGLPITEEEIDHQLVARQGGKTPYTTSRKEPDTCQILSGVFERQTTGAPLAIWIPNRNVDSKPYEMIKDLYRPGHANFTYLQKYGIFDYKGGGRSSARETVARVAAAAVAKKLLSYHEIKLVAYLSEMGGIKCPEILDTDLPELRVQTHHSPVFCPDLETSTKMMEALTAIKSQKDSFGGIVSCLAKIPAGLGDPIYHKLEAELAFAMLSIPASKGFEIGEGFAAAKMRGSAHNDPFTLDEKNEVKTQTNSSGGTLGGISTGSNLYFKVAFKPTSSIQKPQETISQQKEKKIFAIPPTGKHDPCVAIRAVIVVEAMTAITLADRLLMNRLAKVCQSKVKMSPP